MGLMLGLFTLSAYILHLKKIDISFQAKNNFFLVLLASIALIALFFFLAYKCRKSCENNESKFVQRFYAYGFVILTSLVFSAVISIYKLDSLIFSFGVTALVFGINAINAHCSKED